MATRQKVSEKQAGTINTKLEQNEARVKAGLPPIVLKKRRCLKCDTTFISTHEQRCCDGCRVANSRYSHLG